MNRPTKKSIFVKRLKDSGYAVDFMVEFSEDDPRKWQLLIDRGHGNVFVTCYKTDLFEFYDGEQYHQSKYLTDTASIDVIFQYLNDSGTINKHPHYNTKISEKSGK